jgi:3-deoxy-D-manno-octulosonic-acid transferase
MATAYWVYNVFLSLVALLALPMVPLVMLCGERFRRGLRQRLGMYPRDVLEAMAGSRPIWLHAVSVGEVLSATRLAEELKGRFPQRKILLSTFTATGYEIARRAEVGDAVIFFPLDHPWIVRRALSLFDPCMLIFLETEIWPNFLRLAHRRGVPTLLLSGRLSPRSFRQYAALRIFFSEVVRRFTAVGMQSPEDADRIVRLGADPEKVWVTGSLKHASFDNNGAGPERAARALSGTGEGGARQVLVAGSTHEGEEEILLEVFLALKARFPALMMILAPRHPQRFAEVEKLLKRKGLRYQKRSEMNGRVSSSAEVLFLDTLGELGDFYSIADIAFVGGSLVDAGGHNLIEPARFRKPVLFGPYMTNFAEITAEIKRAGGGIEIRDRDDLVREIGGLLADRAMAKRVGELAYDVVVQDRGVVRRTMDLVSRYLQ